MHTFALKPNATQSNPQGKSAPANWMNQAPVEVSSSSVRVSRDRSKTTEQLASGHSLKDCPFSSLSQVNWSFVATPSHSPLPIQPKLQDGAVDDALEWEADRDAEQIMRTPDPIAAPYLRLVHSLDANLRRKCACEDSVAQYDERKEERAIALRLKAASYVTPAGAPDIVHEVLRSPGQSLDAAARDFMEPRFGHDFGQIRVHADAQAAKSARAVKALAYTVGHHVVFGVGRYDPATREGSKLLAHELTHAAQQCATDVIPPKSRLSAANGAADSEPDRGAANSAVGTSVRPLRRGTPPTIARFTDTGHHVVEEAALAGAGFSESQMKAIERGNIQRDYSQVGWIGNTALLCKPREFGGYRPEEHFDNYLWDAVTRGWRTRGGSALGEQGVDVGKTPIDFISRQLEEVANRGTTDAGMEHLGNAFHTVEDFFAHSNFVELMQGDTRRGATLMTGNPVGPSQSVSRIFEAITPPGIRERYREQSESAINAAAPGTHTAMAHDDPTTANYTVARRLAALVIQDLGTEVLAVMSAPEPERRRLMRERVVAKVVRYIRPPDSKDRWWETLTTADAGRIDRRLDEAARRTPTTVNQCALSPLKNLEASQNSPMALPLGVAIPTTIRGNQAWFQVGAGVTRPFPFEPVVGGPPRDERGTGLVVGAQITGAF